MSERLGSGFTDADPLPGSELAAFTAAVESGSIQGAADALDLTQSAATKRLQSLERRLGQDLLVRGRGGTRPTELGRAVYPLAKQALAALAEVGRAAGTVGGETLRLSASLTTGEFLLPGWLARFRAERPDVHPQLAVVNSSIVAQQVSERLADIGFVESRADLGALDSLVVATDELVVVVAAGHRWARRRSVKPSDLLTEPYLTREPRSGTRAVADAELERAGVELLPALEAASLQSLKRAVTTGGFTVISALTIEAEQGAGMLVGLPIAGLDLSRELHAIRLPAARRAEQTAALWDWLSEHTRA